MIITRRRTVQGLLGLSLGGIATAATGGRAGAQSPDQTELVDRAKGTSHPDEVSTAQRYFVQVLELRRDGIAHIAQQLRTALSGQTGQDAVGRIESTSASGLGRVWANMNERMAGASSSSK